MSNKLFLGCYAAAKSLTIIISENLAINHLREPENSS